MKVPKAKLMAISTAIMIIFIIAFMGMYGFSPQESQQTDQKEEEAQKKAKEAEDLKGREQAWEEQRGYPGTQIPPEARQQAILKKNLLEQVLNRKETYPGIFARDYEDLEGRIRQWYYQRLYPDVNAIEKIKTDKNLLAKFGSFRLRAISHKLRMQTILPRRTGQVFPHIPPSSTIQPSPGAPTSPALPVPPLAGICNWVSIGPRNINGRIRSLAIHPTNGNIIYAGAAEGGVWKSTNSGQSWVPLMQYEDSIAIGAIAINPTNPNIIYAGTGEPTTWPGYNGSGVFKSTDGGNTWSPTGALDNGHIARLTIDPTNTNIIYCAGFNGGLYRSTNAGISWNLIRAGDIADFALNPSSSNILYAGVRHDGVYKSTDSGASWTKLAGGLPAMASQRVMLSLCPASPNTIYAKLDETVYKTTNAGANWTNQGNHGSATYGYWCNYVAVDPTNANIVFAAGMSLEKSTNGGTSWNWSYGTGDAEKTALHSDQHAMVFDPSNHLKIYAANDGGVYLSTDGANTWKKVSDGLIVSQFYDAGDSTLIPSLVGGGLQDQGTVVTTGGLTWEKVYGADGGFLVFHATEPYVFFGETQYNNIIKSTNGGDTWGGATTGLAGSGPWVGIITQDQAAPNILFTGRQQVFRSTDTAANWSASSPAVGGNVSAIAIAPSNHLIIYAGTSTGKIWKSTNGGATMAGWSDITSAPLPNRYLSDIAIHRTNPNIVYLTYSGFTSITPATPGHVFRSTNGGTSWTNISGIAPNDLPDMPATAIEIDANNSNILYVGTDVGIFRTTNLGTAWVVFEPGLPNTAISDLEFDETRNLLTAATHGRGMWQIDVDGSCTNSNIYVRDNELDTGIRQPSPENVTDPLSVVRGGILGERVYHWTCADIKVDAQPYYIPDALFDGVEFDRDLVHDSPIRNRVNRVYVQVHNRGPINAANVTVKILWTSASAGLPPLPADFWTAYPGNSSNTSVWSPIGTTQTIPVLEPSRPVILTWNWTPPASAPTHSCIIAVINSAGDPTPAANKSLDPDWVV
ncbi:MAG: hypothetical protein MUF15_08870, partial [Acidobacteria bacterium]|nr:hypothetical protein [Acidobacteriota bacterium]